MKAFWLFWKPLLRCNDFEFNGRFYLQTCGISMGRKYSPAAANIYLRRFDHHAMYGFRIKPRYYSRFLDDIFAVWPGTRHELLEFQYFLNNLIPGIKVTFTIRNQITEFLDTQVYKGFNADGQCVLKTKVFLNRLILISCSTKILFILNTLLMGLPNPN